MKTLQSVDVRCRQCGWQGDPGPHGNCGGCGSSYIRLVAYTAARPSEYERCAACGCRGPHFCTGTPRSTGSKVLP